ncbi:GIY-YIG nuclease family protein [Vibrio vulnificus]|nr:GIY-YIG nuclease family protein [Vibrio vulnificus]
MNGIIYFLHGETTGLVKIGWTRRSLVRRVNQLQTGSPDRLRLLGFMRAQKFAKSNFISNSNRIINILSGLS